MGTFILRSGTHTQGKTQFEVGDEIESDAPLHKLFKNKFEKVSYKSSPKSKSHKEKEEDEDEKEGRSNSKSRARKRAKERKDFNNKKKKKKSKND